MKQLAIVGVFAIAMVSCSTTPLGPSLTEMWQDRPAQEFFLKYGPAFKTTEADTGKTYVWLSPTIVRTDRVETRTVEMPFGLPSRTVTSGGESHSWYCRLQIEADKDDNIVMIKVLKNTIPAASDRFDGLFRQDD